MGIYLGIDIGTQGVKVLCLDVQARRVVASASAPLELISRDDGSREQLAEWWLAALRRCMASVDPGVRGAVAGIGVSGQQHGLVALDRKGTVLAPAKLWCDTATTAQCHQIMAAMGGEEHCLKDAGNPILPGYTASKILWLKQQHPHLYGQMTAILLPHDYINFYLTGEQVMECGDASGTGLLDIRQRQWHDGLLAAVDNHRDLRECLPPLVPANRPIGTLRAVVAGELGLPEGIPVSCGGGDNMMAAIGTGNVASGRLTVSLGTSGTLFAYSSSPVIDEGGEVAAFCDSTGGWLPLVCTMNCTVATELTRDLLGVPLASLDERIAGVPAGAGGVVTLPFFQGERTPNLPAARGCVLGLNPDNYTADNLLRSAMEAAVYGLRAGLDALDRLGCDIAEVRLTGGGAASGVWRQMVADIFALPVSVPAVNEGAALGAALQACWVTTAEGSERGALVALVDDLIVRDGDGDCMPDPPTAAAYGELFQHYRAHVAAIAPLYAHQEARS